MKNLIILVLFIFPVTSLAASVYTLGDLKNLAKSKSWIELTEHLTDITPANRNKDWAELANLALTSHFKELVSSGNSKTIVEFLEKTFPKYPSLRNNKTFMSLRSEFGLRYYESCFSYNDEACHKELLGFVKADPDPLFAVKIAKLVRRRMSDIKAIEYFEVALSQKSIKSICEDDDLKLSLENALQTRPGSDYAKSAKKVAFGQCFEKLKGNIKTAVKNNDDAKSNACAEMLARNALKGISKKKCARFLKK